MKQAGRLFTATAAQWISLAVLVAAMFAASKRAAIPALVAVLKFVWPFIVVWIVWRFVKGRITSAMQRIQNQVMQVAQQGGMSGVGATAGPSAPSDVLDLCPKCGTLLMGNHRCTK